MKEESVYSVRLEHIGFNEPPCEHMTLGTNDFIEQITVSTNENKGHGTILTGIKVNSSDGRVIQVGNIDH